MTSFFTSCHLDNMAGVGVGTEAKLRKRFGAQLRTRVEMEANSVRHSRKWYLGDRGRPINSHTRDLIAKRT